MLGDLEVLKVPMVRPHQERMLSTLQPVPPLLERQLDGQQLPVTHVVPGFRRAQPVGEEGAGVDLAVLSLL